jgi:hypothetical protein
MPQHDLSQTNISEVDEKRSPSFRSASQDFVPPTPKHAKLSEEGAAPRFKLSHLWSEPILNPLNLKAMTLPLLRFSSPVSLSTCVLDTES